MVTMGNLFSGSGTWELAAKICGMEVKFEAEIEKFPVAVEAKRFPNAIQLGDVSKIDGHDIPIVDFICNSSPCQDLSVAGKRAGLAGDRSGLFDQAIRITKEMREHDEQLKRVTGADVPRGLIRPRIFGWENVPGALSSGAEKGADFREVLSSIVGIVEEKHSDIPIPRWGGGTTPDYWTEMDGKLLGVSWTPNTSEAVPPSDGDVCLLSRILEDTVPEKYYLSQRACLGIIRRSCKRGKTLPAVLMSALQKQAGLSDAEIDAMKAEA